MNAPIKPTEFSHGAAAQGAWQLAWASCVGSRHAAIDTPCEDTVAYRFHGDGALAIVVCDGVSGGALGKLASYSAARYCRDHFPAGLPPQNAPADLQTHLNGLDSHVSQALTQHTARTGATTLAAAWLQADGSGWLTYLGDVRAYLIDTASNSDHLQALTRDHTYTLLGQLPPHGIPADNPARMAGNGSAGSPPLQALELQPGQALLLCSDGLHAFVTDREIAAALQRCGGNLAKTPRRLLRLALQNGSDDDIAVMLISKQILTS